MKWIKATIKTAVLTCIATMLITLAVFADDASVSITSATIDSENTVSLECEIVNPSDNQQITVLVAKFVDEEIDYDDIVYINQFDYDDTFTLTFPIDADDNSGYVLGVGGSDISEIMQSLLNTVSATLRGDADGDNEITASDATAILRNVANIELMTDDTLKENSDADTDGNITASDATAVLRDVANIEAINN